MRPVYVDTGPLYALADPRDQAHERALAAIKVLQERRIQAICPTSTLLELHTLCLRRRPERAAAVTYAAYNNYAIVHPEGEDYQAGLELVGKFSDQGITLTDAVLANIAKRRGGLVFTFDERHFRLMEAQLFNEHYDGSNGP